MSLGRPVASLVAVVAFGVVMFGAAIDLDKALAEADGRKRAAENGLRTIKTSSAESAAEVRAAYTEAAVRNNAWLDEVCDSIQSGSASPPDVTATVESAATSLVEWVSKRNSALNMPVPNESAGETVRKMVRQHLTDMASALWTSNRRADEAARSRIVRELKERLRWKSWEEIE